MTNQQDWTRFARDKAPAYTQDQLADDTAAVWVHDASGYFFEEGPQGYTVTVLNTSETTTSLDYAQQVLEELTDGFEPL
jgi:hypothetical protein